MKRFLSSMPTPVFAPDGTGAPPAAAPPAGPRVSAFDPPAAAAPPAAPPAGAPPVAPPAAPPAGDAKGWLAKLTPEQQAYATNKGWKDDTDPAVIMDSYQNLEKLMGADKAGRTVLLPKDANDKEALDVIWDKLGRPKDPTGYTIELPEGADPAFANTAKGWFHKAGLTADQAKAVTANYRAAELDQAKQLQDAHANEVESLQREWGDKFDTRVETARAALKAAGFTPDEVKRMEYSLGPLAFTKKMEFFGRNYQEAGPPGTDTRTAPGFGALTPGQADAKMAQLRTDKNFMERYNNPDPKVRAAAIEEMDNLAKLAVNARS